MRCIYCGYEDTKVIDSRPAPSNEVWRRRECKRCKNRFTTYESARIRKKDDRR